MEMLPNPMMSPRSGSRTYGGNNAFHNFYNDYSHIADPNLRRRLALSEIDKVPFGMYHVRAVAVAGVGFFLDSYDIFAINLITTFLGLVFWYGPSEDTADGYGGNNGQLPTEVSQALKASTSAGIVIGQILFGWLADVFGRRKMYGIELGIIVVSTLSCALVSPSPSVTFTGIMVFWRVMMGVGIGGDYPLSSVITSEFAPTRWRGAMVAAVFSMQGIGQLFAAVAALLVTIAFRTSFMNADLPDSCDEACRLAADRSWRIIVGVGALPAVFALYYRITIPETPRYTFDVAHDVEKADADIKAYIESKPEGKVDKVRQARLKVLASPSLTVPRASWDNVFKYFREWKNAKVLIGTTMSWFFLDLAFYGLGLNNTIVLRAIGYFQGANMYHTLYNNAMGMIILACAGSIPGYWLSILLIDTVGRKPLQVLGFLSLTIIFAVLGFCYHSLSQGALLALYIIAQFLFNLGPNTTTFVVPGECFPTRYRSTGHGISAAMGKVGAIIAQVISVPLLAKDAPADCSAGTECSPWLGRLMQMFAFFMLLGFLFSFLIPETKGITLEELAGEAPTSYNAGRNGSIGPAAMGTKGSGGGPGGRPGSRGDGFVLRFAKKWNPFKGGKPAGFIYPRAKGYGAGRRRVGIMTSPELASMEEARDRRRGRLRAVFGRNSRKMRGNSGMSAEAINSPARASSSRAGDAGRSQDVPGWGAGWGRIDRGPTPMDGIRLQDVGALLK